MNEALVYAVVFIGGGIGSMMRHGANRAGFALFGPAFPAGTLFANVVGCALIGAFAGWFAFRGEATTQELRLFLTTGICGGFTTFSAFSLDTVVMWERGDYALCIAYVAASFVISLGALLASLAATRTVLAG